MLDWQGGNATCQVIRNTLITGLGCFLAYGLIAADKDER